MRKLGLIACTVLAVAGMVALITPVSKQALDLPIGPMSVVSENH